MILVAKIDNLVAIFKIFISLSHSSASLASWVDLCWNMRVAHAHQNHELSHVSTFSGDTTFSASREDAVRRCVSDGVNYLHSKPRSGGRSPYMPEGIRSQSIC